MSDSEETNFDEKPRLAARPKSSKHHHSASSSSSRASSASSSAMRYERDPSEFSHLAVGSLSIEETVPATILFREEESASRRRSSGTTSSRTASSGGPSFSLLSTMREASKPPSTTDVFKHNMLAAIAEDPELASTITDFSASSMHSKKTVEAICKAGALDVDAVARALSVAQKISLCFLLDTTGSMAGHIIGVKSQVKEIVKAIKASGCTIAGLAFVGYKDWCDGSDHFEVLDFTTDLALFDRFLGGIKATGGGDGPEDVLGGIDRTISLSWAPNAGSRIVFHIGDAPPHGKRFTSMSDDQYPSGHPNDKPPEALFRKMKQLSIMYYFGKMNNECEQMLKEFSKCSGSPVDKFDVHNVSSIASSVTAGVMKSVSIMSASSSLRKGLRERPHVITSDEPDFTRMGWADCTIVSFDLPDSIADVVSFRGLVPSTLKTALKIAPHPFAKGSVRLAFFGQLRLKDGKTDEVIFKEYLRLPTHEELDRSRYMVDLETQTTAAKFAFEFNDRIRRTSSPSPYKMKFLMAKVVRLKSASGVRFLAQEKKYRDGQEMVRFTNNYKFVSKGSSVTSGDIGTKTDEFLAMVDVCVAFSHFTFQHSDGYLLVCDLQGILTEDRQGFKVILLTDPAIHCPTAKRFGSTNLQMRGVAAFFKTHECNKYCKALGLKVPVFESS